MKRTVIPVALVWLLISASCNAGVSTNQTPTTPDSNFLELVSTETPSPIIMATLPLVFTPTVTPIPSVAPNFCSDSAVVSLIDSLRTSMLSADGALLSSLVTPNGMEVRYFREGNAVIYTPYQAGFLFETTFQANWGNDLASGIEKPGSFQEVVVPEMVKIFNQPYTLHCNEIRHGGATYEVTWSYNKDFYSIHFIGTEQNGYLDWHTWVVGVEYSDSKPYIYALMNFFWEP